MFNRDEEPYTGRSEEELRYEASLTEETKRMLSAETLRAETIQKMDELEEQLKNGTAPYRPDDMDDGSPICILSERNGVRSVDIGYQTKWAYDKFGNKYKKRIRVHPSEATPEMFGHNTYAKDDEKYIFRHIDNPDGSTSYERLDKKKWEEELREMIRAEIARSHSRN